MFHSTLGRPQRQPNSQRCGVVPAQSDGASSVWSVWFPKAHADQHNQGFTSLLARRITMLQLQMVNAMAGDRIEEPHDRTMVLGQHAANTQGASIEVEGVF